MKYFLAFDLGKSYYNKDRYRIIDLTSLDEELNGKYLIKDNNLKYLCNFTMYFEDSKSLKKFLKAKGLINSYDLNRNICFIYTYKDYIKNLDIPYKDFTDYFNYAMLATIIKKCIYSYSSFLDELISYYKFRKYLPDEYYMLYKIFNGEVNDSQTFEIIRKFVENIVSKNGKFNYLSFYELALFVAKYEKKVKIENRSFLKDNKEEENIKYDNLKDRKKIIEEDQLRLF